VSRIFLIFFSFILLYAEESLTQLFKKGYYTKICINRWSYINKYVNKREDLLSIVAYSCLKKRYLTPALDLAKVLNKTPLGRKNATYITTLFLMKKLLLQVLLDDLDLNSIKLPIIKDNNLGIVFFEIQNGNYKIKNNKIFIKNESRMYKVYYNKHYNIVVEEFMNDKLIKKDLYW
jgi:hypothetical protein